MIGLRPAEIDWSEGLPASPQYGDVYHSRDGGPGQARAVFLDGNDLPKRWQGRRHFAVLETGLGGATNLLATWEAWQADPDACDELTYIACELHPWRAADLRRLHGEGPWSALCEALLAGWPPPLEGFHFRRLAGGRLRLLLLWGDAAVTLDRLRARVDAFYLDGFAPDRNPALWSPALMSRLGALAAPGATAATYTVAAPVRAALADAGFTVERRPGYGRKRHCLQARRPGTAAEPTRPRSVAVLGAGVAGLSVARCLAARGRAVEVWDPAPSIAHGASGNPRAVVRPWLTVADTPGARLIRAAFGWARQHYAETPAADWQPCGLLQLPREPRDAWRHPQALIDQGLPDTWMQALDTAAASDRAGLPVPDAALWLPEAGHLSPPDWCRWAASTPGITLRLGVEPPWPALRENHDAVVMACGSDSQRYLPQPLPFSRVRGQLSLLPPGRLPGLRCIVAREGYALPLPGGAALLGATYDRDTAPQPNAAAHAANLARLRSLLVDPPTLALDELTGRVAFRAVLPGRLPALGAVPGLPDAWIAAGYASRGWVWAPLLAEQLAATLLGQPEPLEQPLVDALDPGRFP